MIKLKPLLQEKVVYHGTISDFVDAIEKSGYLKSPRAGARKISGGLTTELGMIWVTPDFNTANYFATGPEARSWVNGTVKRGLKAEYGGVFELEIEDDIKLIDRYAPLTQEQVDILNAKFMPHYKPLQAGNTLSTAEHRLYEKDGLHDMVLALGYDGISYDKGMQIGIARDSLPIKMLHKKPIRVR